MLSTAADLQNTVSKYVVLSWLAQKWMCTL